MKPALPAGEKGPNSPRTCKIEKDRGIPRSRFHGERTDHYAAARPGERRGVHGLRDLVREAREAGELDLPREDILLFAAPHEGEVTVNVTRVLDVMGTDPFDLTAAERAGRRQAHAVADFLRRRVPGFRNAWLVQSGAAGIRETRRIEQGALLGEAP